MNEKLKPCPFCNGEAHTQYTRSNGRWYVVCGNCHASTTDYLDSDDAIKAWNERASGIKLAEARNEFMDVVYDELSDDADNCRANRIIDAADEIYDVLHRSGEE